MAVSENMLPGAGSMICFAIWTVEMDCKAITKVAGVGDVAHLMALPFCFAH